MPGAIPQIIQGGMGAGVSDWRLARAVSMAGQLGVVSGTAIDLILVRRLQLGDAGRHMRRALEAFPDAAVAERILGKYFIPGGKSPDAPFKAVRMVGRQPQAEHHELQVAGSFVEVFLAREGHTGPIGINFLEKIQAPTLPSLYGAMLAGATVVLMGAGIPQKIPGILDRLADNGTVELDLNVAGATSKHTFSFDPTTFFSGSPPAVARPLFFPIVASATLATMMVRKANGRVDGLIVEGPTAGGHNAPPRGRVQRDSTGQPIYGDRDVVDHEAIAALDRPFWLAGSYGSPEGLVRAHAAGATGIQVGTLFAFCEESGLREDLKQQTLDLARAGRAHVFTDPIASPTGFPFKVLSLPNTNSERAVYEERRRVCDLGLLRGAYERPDGSLGWRCPSEPQETYIKKGGVLEDTVGRKCLCNSLAANIGLEQVRSDGTREPPLVTCGDGVAAVVQRLEPGQMTYSASAVIDYLLSAQRTPAAT